MARVLIILVVLTLTIYCAVEVAQSETYRIRHLPKWFWAVIVIFIPVVGPTAWLLAGRPLPPGRSEQKSPQLPPDDDPDFLRSL